MYRRGHRFSYGNSVGENNPYKEVIISSSMDDHYNLRAIACHYSTVLIGGTAITPFYGSMNCAQYSYYDREKLAEFLANDRMFLRDLRSCINEGISFTVTKRVFEQFGKSATIRYQNKSTRNPKRFVNPLPPKKDLERMRKEKLKLIDAIESEGCILELSAQEVTTYSAMSALPRRFPQRLKVNDIGIDLLLSAYALALHRGPTAILSNYAALGTLWQHVRALEILPPNEIGFFTSLENTRFIQWELYCGNTVRI